MKVRTVSGDTEFEEIGGYLDIKTISGHIKVSSAVDGVRCNTVSGDIQLKKIIRIVGTDGAHLNVSTFSGDVNINKF